MTAATSAAGARVPNRWLQLIIGILCMALVANLQYAWTLFVSPMEAKNHWGLPAIQLAFSIFIVVETWLVPIEGWAVDKFGPRPVVAFGAIMAGFGAGAAVTVIPIGNMIQTSGYEHAFLFFGIAQGAIIFILALFLLRPVVPAGVRPAAKVVSTKANYTPGQMLKTPVFWLTYVLFVAVAAGGLMATAQIGPIAKDYGIAKMPVTMLGMTLPLLTMTLSIDNLCNGFTRPLCGFISDRIGRENVMMIVFVGEGLSMLGLMKWGHDPMLFMTFAALTFLFWGEIFSIFPAIVADTFGVKNAAGNAGTMYTAKGTAALLVPVASLLAKGGNWDRVFIVGAIITITAGVAARFILAPMRRRLIEHSNGLVEKEEHINAKKYA